MGYAQAIHPRVALGVTIRSSAWEATGLSRRSWGLDVGGTYNVGYIHPRASLRLAMMLKDVNRANTAAGGQAAGKTSRALVLAAALNYETQQILIDVERWDGWTEVRGGYETSVISLGGSRFRIGGSAMGPNWAGEKVNVGIGQDWKKWHFDYAYTYPLRVSSLGGMHRFSLKYYYRR